MMDTSTTNIINPDILKNAVTALLGGEVVQIGLGFDIALEVHSEHGNADKYKLHYIFNIYDSAAMNNEILHVKREGINYTASVWHHEEYATFSIKESLFHNRRKIVVSTLEQIIKNVLPQLFSNRIIEAHERIREIGMQEKGYMIND